MKKISIIVPVYDEENNVADAYNALKEVMQGLVNRYDYEIIFTDNHSEDRTFSLIQEIAKKDPKVKAARFSRNFGYQRSIYTGYLLSSGDAAIQFDCDLQDPPQLIAEFIKKWEEGYDIVYGIRRTREEPWLIHVSRKSFYRVIAFLSTDNLPQDAGDFRLLDKKIITELRQLYDYSPYIRGLVASFGFNQTGIPYDRPDRRKGKSKFRLMDMVGLAMDGIANHSIVPLRLATYCGLIAFVSAIIILLVLVIGKLFFAQDWPRGYTTLIIAVMLSLGLNALFLGVIGEYIGRIYQQVKRRPLTIIDKLVNFDDSK